MIIVKVIIDIIAGRTDLVTAASDIAIVASDADKGANNKSTIVPSIFFIRKLQCLEKKRIVPGLLSAGLTRA